MKQRPVDPSGDVLSVLHISDMIQNAGAIALLVKNRLSLLYGEWWENSGLGFPVLRSMEESRLSETDIRSFSSMITEYLRQTEGVRDAEKVTVEISGKTFRYSCTVLTDYGPAEVFYISAL